MQRLKGIDGKLFADALTSGIHRVIGQQDLLNRINVFPVPDSDTGTNLSLSLSAALGVLRDSRDNNEQRHLGTLLAATADALLDGARGNSGAIVAQFFQGFSDSAGEITRMTAYTFSKAVRMGSDYAHDALSEPREGTILSVIAAFADSLEHHVGEAREADVTELLSAAKQRVDDALEKTTEQLDVLRKAGVVDAGAKGFAELVAGMLEFLQTGVVAPLPEGVAGDESSTRQDAFDHDASRFRYCTECLIVGDDIDRRKLREALDSLGDSLVLAGSKRKAKVHIHVDNPDNVFDISRRFGVVKAEKADDMQQQQHASHSKSSQLFAVITDSGADVSDDDLEDLDIHMVPCRIQFGDRGFLDKVSITTDEFYKELETNPHHPTTSQPAPGDFRRQFQFLASHFPEVLSINLTSNASGTFQGAESAASRVQASGRIHVVDSRNASIGQGLLVVLAARCARAGLSLQQTREIIDAQIPQVQTYALLENLVYAVRGGRLPGWVQTVARLLNLQPIITMSSNGRVKLAGFLFGRRNRSARFARFVSKRLRQDTPLEMAVGHAMSKADAELLRQHLSQRISLQDQAPICDLGTAIGVHGGPGTLIAAAQPRVSVETVVDRVD